MFHLRQIAGILAPCCVLAGCASLPELPAVTAMHPAHPDAQAAPTRNAPSILDGTAMEAAPQPAAMDMGEMDHSHHNMKMGDEKLEPDEKPDDGECNDDGPADHGGDDES